MGKEKNYIKLNDIFNLTGEEINNSKIELNIRAGKDGDMYLDKWIKLSDDEKRSGITNCSYWPHYGNQTNFKIGQKVFSFIRKEKNEEWLFISAGIISEIPSGDRAKVKILEEYKPLFGRLVMYYYKGNTRGRYTFNLKRLKGEEYIKEILPSMYNGEQFEGYDHVHLPFKKLDDILQGRIMPEYRKALEKITGIYCLTDKKTGKLYIGSASGEEGVAQRWSNYLKSKDGGNKKLIKLYKEQGNKYFEENFYFTLLEFFSLSCNKDKILEREGYWKKCLDTIKHGYN